MGSLRVGHDFTFTFHFHALEKEMATHSSVLAWRIPGTGEPGGLLSMGSHRVGHDWGDLAAAAMMPFEKQSFFKKNLMMSSVSCFLLLLMLLVSYLRNHCLIQGHKDLCLCFPLRFLKVSLLHLFLCSSRSIFKKPNCVTFKSQRLFLPQTSF